MASARKFALHPSTPPRATSFLVVSVQTWLLLLVACICPAQDVEPPTDGRAFSFGVTVVSSSWLKGDIYLLPPNTYSLPNFKKLKSIGSVYTPFLYMPTRAFLEGFPGISNRFEWFAIDYSGRFWVSNPGKYRFALKSDDGSKLYIDSKTIIGNDGVHPPTSITGTVNLVEGMHTIRVSYFQGPRYQIALILAVSEPGQKELYVFNMEKYLPPADRLKDRTIDQTPDADSGKE
jgi:hypothetical protein